MASSLDAMNERYPEILCLAEALMRACNVKGLRLTGFVFGAQVLMHFGNLKETGPDLTAMHLQLCDLVDRDDNDIKTIGEINGG